MVRQNYFEWMFHPITAAGLLASAADLDDKEMVMVVRIGQESRAYPILQMAYHHILNDTVADVPIVVTYLNALSHWSGVEENNAGTRTAFLSRRNHNREFSDARP